MDIVLYITYLNVYISDKIVLFCFMSHQISKMIVLSTSHLWFKTLAWHRTGVMPLHETKMALLTDANVRYLASMS